MAEKILKNVNNKIWETTSHQIIKKRPFLETPIQDGLEFWGQANNDYITLIDGRVSAVYDVRRYTNPLFANVKMIQNTVTWRPYFANNYIYSGGLVISGQTAKSMFIVMKYQYSINYNGLGNFYENMIGWKVSTFSVYNGTYYYNNTFQTGNINPSLTNKFIVSTVSPLSCTTVYLGDTVSGSNGQAIFAYEWGWYNRVLNPLEAYHNVTAMNLKYSVF